MTLCTGYVAAGKSGPSSHLIFKHLSVEVGKRQVRAPGRRCSVWAFPCQVLQGTSLGLCGGR